MNACRHSMPFGAEACQDGRVRFRLWAPAAERVDLCLDGGEVLAMGAEDEGWFALTTDRAGPGSLYRYRIDGGMQVPDPASRFQPADVHGPSEVIDPLAWRWRNPDWDGRPWEESVIYELHVGTFTPSGGYAGVREKLAYLVQLGITAIELMPLADFPGDRNWGYDGVYPYAPDSCYGRPEELKALVDAAHGVGLMVFMDVVYNHFGPEGNYLHLYAPQFFSTRHHTPWGVAINYDGPSSHWVRQFAIHNALYWLEEYRLDGLRLDAVHAIDDDSRPDILVELADCVRQRFDGRRHVHLVLENDHNTAHYLVREGDRAVCGYDAQWNDDIHHALHVLLTGESDGYYRDYADSPLSHLGRCLGEGFAYQGEPSPYRDHRPRGEASGHLPATAFVSFLQNHDQVGNRALGERIGQLSDARALRAVSALLLLAPAPPLLFMGQEWGCSQPFPYFCDFGPDVAQRVTSGRFEEVASQGRDASVGGSAIPDPQDPETFSLAVLDWDACGRPVHRDWLALHQEILALRRQQLLPRLTPRTKSEGCRRLGERALAVTWRLGDGSRLRLLANLGDTALNGVCTPGGHCLYRTAGVMAEPPATSLPPWSVLWYLDEK